jgi:exonuclease III
MTRILAWNLNHRASRKPVRESVASAILATESDAVVLNEYVEGKDHGRFLDQLASGGLTSVRMTSARPRYNQIMIACAQNIEQVEFEIPDELEHAANNLLYVRVPTYFIDVMGIRVPWYVKSREARSYWDWFAEAVRPLRERPLVIVGDFNADPERVRGRGTTHLTGLRSEGWQIPCPAGDWSFYSAKGKSSRIDHALLTPSMNLVGARYITELSGHTFAGPGIQAVSDHAALLLDVMPPARRVAHDPNTDNRV